MSDGGSTSRILAGLISGAATLAAAVLTLWLRDRTKLSKRIQMFDAATKELGFWEMLLRLEEHLPHEQKQNLHGKIPQHLAAMLNDLMTSTPTFIFSPHSNAWARAVNASKNIYERGTRRWEKWRNALRLLSIEVAYITISVGVLSGFGIFGYGIYRALSLSNLHELETAAAGLGTTVILLFIGGLFVYPLKENAEQERRARRDATHIAQKSD